MGDKSSTHRKTHAGEEQGSKEKEVAGTPRDKRSGREWVNDAANARTADDPRARTPSDAAGQPSGRPFEE